MANISSIGISSGVLTSDLIDQLAEAEREPTELRLNRKEEEVSAKLSDLGRIKSAVTDLRLSSRSLGNPEALQDRTVTSTNSGISATADSDASTGSYQVDVTNLATAHSLSSAGFADKSTTTVGTGTLAITAGSKTVNIAVDSSNNTLEGLASAINSEDLNVSASVIYTGTEYKLVLSSTETGTDNAISITVTDDDGNHTDATGLSQFTFNATTQRLNESVVAENAEFTVNGIPITRSSNKVDDVIDGVTLDFSVETDGSPATLTVGIDTQAISDRVQDFVDKYNALKEIINEVTEFNPDGAGGNLLGNSTVRSVSSQVRSVLSNVVPGLETANIRSLSEIGISTNKDTGLLTFDTNAFADALSSSPKDVVALFADQGRTTDSQVKFVSNGINTKVGTYNVEIDTLATQGAINGTKDVSAGVTIGANNDTFKLQVNGTETNTITLTAGTYTSAQLVAEIQNQLNADTNLKNAGVSVGVSLDASNQIKFTSSTFGSASNVNITEIDVDSLADLGFSVASGTAGVDVAGKINGVAATGSGRFLTANTGDASGIKLEITGGATGSRGTVSYIEGVGDQMVDLINGFLAAEGMITVAEQGYNKQLESVAGDRLEMEQRITTLRERLAMQFTTADILVGRLNSTKDFLESQFKALSGSNDN